MARFVKKDRFLDYEIIRTNKKKEYYLTSIQDGVVYLRVPEYATDKDIRLVLDQQFPILYYKIHPQERYILHFRGKPYLVRCVKGKTDRVTVGEGQIVIRAVKVTRRYYKTVLDRFFTQVVEQDLAKLMYDAQYDFREISCKPIVVKPLAGALGRNWLDRIEISSTIAKYDPKFVKVLLYHELCHDLVRNHEREFWDLLNRKLPDGEALNMQMRQAGKEYIRDYL